MNVTVAIEDLAQAEEFHKNSKPSTHRDSAISEITTQNDLTKALISAGLVKNDLLLAHTSMSSLGHFPGAESGIIDSLYSCVGEKGGVIFPAFTGNNSDPRYWRAPPVLNNSVRVEILKESEAFDPDTTSPWKRVGKIPLKVLQYPKRFRSFHPQLSFLGLGQAAERILYGLESNFDFPFSTQGALGRLSDARGKVLFLGTSWKTCTALHLVEHLHYGVPPQSLVYREISAVKNKSTATRELVAYNLMKLDTSDFEAIGALLEQRQPELFSPKKGANTVPAPIRLFPLKELLNHGLQVMRELRGLSQTTPPN